MEQGSLHGLLGEETDGYKKLCVCVCARARVHAQVFVNNLNLSVLNADRNK